MATDETRKLIVTADDFGASHEVNAAVEQAHRDGILTAASLMVAGDAAADAAERARRLPRLGVGLHLVLVEGRPILPPKHIPALVDRSGQFRTDMVRTALTIFASPSARRQLAAEIEAQFAAFAATGLRLDHVNAHKHFHLHPTIASAILRAGKRHGMTAMRAPIEPPGVIAAIDGTPRRAGIEHLWAKVLRRRLRKAGVTVPDQVFGLAWSGELTPQKLRALLENLPSGLTEIYAHPALGPYPGSAPGYLYAEELAALTDPLAKAAITRNGIACGRFADFDRTCS
ncbi:hopanoid biosynthesis-associated protein HpnK [Novosphingobium sp.]|uniref:hopanoid biosynthesis-associated protein HpnK n=1 Tax=Novosphingobium sp. TaxID=1874826 RepID=UPI001DD774D6|nr:hopanoid biosynthesis-associated protein HpnK [Novosphingobium sp.]MBX9665160.1 hopanoid biosynthesis-associated protein HpnK [Novosphingobium sp.]